GRAQGEACQVAAGVVVWPRPRPPDVDVLRALQNGQGGEVAHLAEIETDEVLGHWDHLRDHDVTTAGSPAGRCPWERCRGEMATDRGGWACSAPTVRTIVRRTRQPTPRPALDHRGHARARPRSSRGPWPRSP